VTQVLWVRETFMGAGGIAAARQPGRILACRLIAARTRSVSSARQGRQRFGGSPGSFAAITPRLRMSTCCPCLGAVDAGDVALVPGPDRRRLRQDRAAAERILELGGCRSGSAVTVGLAPADARGRRTTGSVALHIDSHTTRIPTRLGRA